MPLGDGQWHFLIQILAAYAKAFFLFLETGKKKKRFYTNFISTTMKSITLLVFTPSTQCHASFKLIKSIPFSKGLHPRIVTEGFEAAKVKALEVLEQVKVSKEMDRETLINVARTSLRTKVHAELADILTEVSDLFGIIKCNTLQSPGKFESCYALNALGTIELGID